MVANAKRVGSVVDERKSMTVGDRLEGLDFAGIAEDMGGEDGLGAGSECMA